MKNKYLPTFFFLFLLLSSIFSPIIALSVTTEDNEENEEDLQYGPRKGNLLDRIIWRRFVIGMRDYIGRYYNFQLVTPTEIWAFPPVIEVEYQNKTTVQIGGKDPDNPDKWQTLFKLIGTYNWGWISNSVTFKFEVIPPEDIEKDSLWYRVDPEYISISPNKENLDWKGIENVIRTNLTIEIFPTKNSTNPTDDFILKVKVIREDVSTPWILSQPPKYVNLRNNKEYQERNSEYTDFVQWDPTIPYYYWYRIFSGKSLVFSNVMRNLPEILITYDIVSILVRVKKDHYADLIPPDPVEIYPDEILSIPVSVKNLGSHIDTFNFRVINNDENIKVIHPSALTIEPGESRNAYVTVSAPPGLRDIGKTISIKLEAYSLEEPENIFSNKITITLQGLHLSLGFVYYIGIAVIFLLIIFSLIYIPLRKRRETICKKPDKPWEIPEEVEHLEKLKEKDEEKYKETLELMKQEYKSALLWHRYFTDAILKENRDIRKKEETKKKDKKLKLKAKIKEEKKEKKAKKLELKKQKEKELKEKELEIKKVEPPKKKEEKLVLIDRKAELEKRKKEITLFKIKREQEKQRKKFGSSI